MSEFSDRPFVAASLVGLRAFGVDTLGRLIGPSYPQVFKPGENEAECLKDQDPSGWGYRHMLNIPSSMFASGGLASAGLCPCGCGSPIHTSHAAPPPQYVGSAGRVQSAFVAAAEKVEIEAKRLSEAAVERPLPEKPKHTVGGLGCKCGFYAYFDGRNTYDADNRIAAIIEGYGICTVGTAGFRAAKARLLALIEPGKDVPLVQLKRNYPDVPMFEHDEAAMERFPLSVDFLPSPDDEDFWTRSAS